MSILTVFALLCLCFQSYDCVGHLSTDYSGLHSGRGLGGSLPYTSGLGQTMAGQHTQLLGRYFCILILNIEPFSQRKVKAREHLRMEQSLLNLSFVQLKGTVYQTIKNMNFSSSLPYIIMELYGTLLVVLNAAKKNF